MKGSQIATFKKWVSAAALALLVLHIIIVLLLTFVPTPTFLGRSKPARVYEHLIHLGPFYRSESIQSSPHLMVSHDGQTIDVVQRHHQKFLDNPTALSELLLRDYARRVGDALARNDRSKNSLRKFSVLAKQEFPDLAPGDTVNVVYLHRWYKPATDTWTSDSIFNSTYSWNENH